MRVTVDVDACCGSGHCVRVVPRVFDQAEDGQVVVLDDTPPSDLAEDVRRAAYVCPARAITVCDD